MIASQGTGAAVTVGTSATVVVAPKTVRKSVAIQNLHASNKLYVGFTSGVTTASGFRLNPDDAISFDDYNGVIYAIADGASTNVRYLEVG